LLNRPKNSAKNTNTLEQDVKRDALQFVIGIYLANKKIQKCAFSGVLDDFELLKLEIRWLKQEGF